jgi:hypothetical protein
MYKNKKISLVIPCHNEERGIEKILSDRHDFIDEVIVVDNNSTDETTNVAKRLGAKVIFEKKIGYGNAYLAGFKYATGDIIVTMDGDDSYSIKEVPGLLKILLDENLDFISGCRFPLKKKRSMKRINRIGNFLLTLFFNILVLKNIKDSQSGMWVFKKKILSRIDLTSAGMPFSEEIKMEILLNKKIRFKEINIFYRERTGQVKLKIWRDGLLNMLFLFKKRFDLFLRISR